MKIRLISYTQPVEELVSEGIENATDLIAYCARVSNKDNQHNTKTANNLLDYLMKNKHWSPLEMVDLTFEIETTRDIARQILRHRSFTFQEFSQRYAVAPGFELSECRLQDNKNRQNSIEIGGGNLPQWWRDMQRIHLQMLKEVYEAALEQGIAKEVARKILPEGLTVSRLYMKGSLRSWIHYLQLRLGNGTQKEHREIAKAISKVVIEWFPMAEGRVNPENY